MATRMKLYCQSSTSHNPHITSFIFIFIFLTLPSLITSQTCKRSCDKIPLRFPFGSDAGCGYLRFRQSVTCNKDTNELTFTTHTGSYPITNIDYTKQTIYISDPSMSTCSCTQPSKGFGLNYDAPFSFQDDNIFALIDCSTSVTSFSNGSSLYSPANSNLSLCDNQGAPICSFLYSCRAISLINLPISTCCVYTPVDLGPAFEMNLEKLQCSSYSGFYSFNGRESDPNSWKYGIALKYKFNLNNEYPISCASCERSNGVCGYFGAYNTFVCNCPNGLNTTNDCYFGASYSYGSRLIPSWHTGTWLIYCLAWLLVSLLL